MSEGPKPLKEIESASNAVFKTCRSLLTGSGIRKHQRALMSGAKQTLELARSRPAVVEAWITGPDHGPPPGAFTAWYRMAADLFADLDIFGTKAPLLLVRLPEIQVWQDTDPWPQGCTLFVAFQDPENVGGVLRSAAAFGVSRVVLLREAAHPFLPKCARAAGPALFQVPLLSGPRIDDLRTKATPLIGLTMTSKGLEDEPFPATFGLVPGIEGPGLPLHLRNEHARCIPMRPGVESLNAATATGIALYAWSRQNP